MSDENPIETGEPLSPSADFALREALRAALARFPGALEDEDEVLASEPAPEAGAAPSAAGAPTAPERQEPDAQGEANVNLIAGGKRARPRDENGRKPTLRARQEPALEALLSGATVTEAAQAARVTRQTVSGWLYRDPLFIAELRDRRGELWDALRVRLAARATAALDALVELLKHEDWRARIAAARLLLSPIDMGQELGREPAPTWPEEVAAEWTRDQAQARALVQRAAVRARRALPRSCEAREEARPDEAALEIETSGEGEGE